MYLHSYTTCSQMSAQYVSQQDAACSTQQVFFLASCVLLKEPDEGNQVKPIELQLCSGAPDAIGRFCSAYRFKNHTSTMATALGHGQSHAPSQRPRFVVFPVIVCWLPWWVLKTWNVNWLICINSCAWGQCLAHMQSSGAAGWLWIRPASLWTRMLSWLLFETSWGAVQGKPAQKKKPAAVGSVTGWWLIKWD